MNTPGRTAPNEQSLATHPGTQVIAPDFQYPLPSRPELHKQDVFNLIRLVIFYRHSWEIYIEDDGIWTAQGRTLSNRWARFEADSATHLEEMIKGI
jgi:hypothetical protein